MFTHTDQKDFKCEICETAFRTKGSLIRHNRRHTGKTKRACVGLYWVVKVVLCKCFTVFLWQMSVRTAVISVAWRSESPEL